MANEKEDGEFPYDEQIQADGFLVERCLEYVDFYPKLPAIPDTTQDVFVDNEVLSIWGPFLKDEDDSRLVMFFYTVSG